ncbi:heterokaryon incompatibility protein-domain-containing protein [Plectosphaerella plurivora]|uniref:Heterokaryon incompatibility protein-domain-containing protein n=1 Tax=Plectosphaerella plurivora TaxID=936078 RepID=A0A9P8V4V0_9PEZI|nr:heterokaryon incompatibility protein-domain-containing protein [Plectosphaerella plurivora]
MGDAMDDLRPSTVYSALPFDDSFRLLELDPSTDFTAPIVCHLRPSRHSDHPRYHALSYSWQSDEADASPMSIQCNGHDMEIESNLWHALRRLRQTDTTNVVWADALCINQADTAERNHQVRQMGAVYSGAELVVVWLGEGPPPETGINIEAGLLAMLAVWRSWHDDHDSVGSSFQERQAAGTPIPVEDLELFDRYSRRLTAAEARAVTYIFQRAWFRRLWVVQEVMLAKDSLAMLDKYEIRWSVVALAAQLARRAPEVAAVVGDDVETYRAIECACKIQHIWSLCLCAPYFPFEFHDLLVLTRDMQCQDPRDRIFGLLAIPTTRSDGKMEADYGLSAGEVFRRTAVRILETADSLDLLSDCQHEAEMEPWLPGPGAYPSWVPQWHIRPHMRLLDGRRENFTKKYRAAGSKRRELKWTANGHPRVKGVEVARVKEASRVLADDCFERSDGRDLDSVFATTTSPPTGTDILLPGTSTPLAVPEDRAKLLSIMLRTLSGLSIPSATRMRQYVAVLMKGYLRWSLPDVSNGGIVFKPPSAWDQKSWEAMDSIVGNVLGTEDEFLSWVKMVCANRRLFLTDDGEVGLGPGVMRPGDVVCVLYGMRVPVVLRRIGETYAVVGECYVDGLMKGSAVGEGSKGVLFREASEDLGGLHFIEVGEESEGDQFREVVERWFELV